MVLRQMGDIEAAIVTDDCNGFVVVPFAALVVDVVLIDEIVVLVSHCKLVVFLVFDAAASVVVLD